ncbi:MAG: hypothetical protein AVDCRST_MAG51-128 [uncultured Ramlibacter sp.]|uniref:RcnB family protein n=1 Tax=uncultured Ramlibacter sp. TaxID=260755 RepID=A0A6J4NBY8_9BURK|nr:MAG: hypothetical protein AVDCRST_MAG51-128 [uncultured Ramlibacter sp.]
MFTQSSKLALRSLVVALACTLAVAPALGGKPEGEGGGKHGKKDKENGGGKQGGKHARGDKGDKREARVGGYFNDRDRQVARISFGESYGGGKSCPPGLAKKNNGCMPPGQAKKYAVGRPLPSDVVFYPVPPAVVVQLPAPPIGHKYVRVAADILLIAVGTSMVVDAMTDLGRL